MWVVALPANVVLAVTGHVDFLDVSVAGSLRVMAFAAELPIGGTGGDVAPGVHVVLFGGVVATCTWHVHVFRERLCPRNRRVAGLASLGGVRTRGIVRFVARYTRFPRVVRGRYDLRKTCWS